MPPPLPPPPGDGSDAGPAPSDRGQPSSVGTIAIYVQPVGSDILIDGEHWTAPMNENERLIVQLTEGRHIINIRRQGYRDFSTEVEVHADATTPLNVSLTPE
jgi:hypothetical protein